MTDRAFASRVGVAHVPQEVVHIRANHTYVMAPSWFHRVIPPHTDAERVPISFVAKANSGAFAVQSGHNRSRVLEATDEYEGGWAVAREPYRVCWRRHDLVQALRGATAEDLSLGLPKLSCTAEPLPLHEFGGEAENVLHLAKASREPQQGDVARAADGATGTNDVASGGGALPQSLEGATGTNDAASGGGALPPSLGRAEHVVVLSDIHDKQQRSFGAFRDALNALGSAPLQARVLDAIRELEEASAAVERLKAELMTGCEVNMTTAQRLVAIGTSLAANDTEAAYQQLGGLPTQHPSSTDASNALNAQLAIVAAMATDAKRGASASERRARVATLRAFTPEQGQLPRLARAFGDGLAHRDPRRRPPLDRPRMGGWIGDEIRTEGASSTASPRVHVLSRRPLAVVVDGFAPAELIAAAAADVNATVQESLHGQRQVCVNPSALGLLRELRELGSMDGVRRKDGWVAGPGGALCAPLKQKGQLDARVGGSSWSISYTARRVSESVDTLDRMISEALGVGGSEEEADAWTTDAQGLYYAPVASEEAAGTADGTSDDGSSAVGGVGSYQLHVDCEDFGQGLSAMRQKVEPADRAVSALLYLSTPVAGGATRFPLVNVSVPPLAGRLLLFETLQHPHGYCDPLAAHVGEAPSDGIVPKIVLQKWVLGKRRPAELAGALRGARLRANALVGEGASSAVSHLMCDVNEVCRTFLRPTR